MPDLFTPLPSSLPSSLVLSALRLDFDLDFALEDIRVYGTLGLWTLTVKQGANRLLFYPIGADRIN